MTDGISDCPVCNGSGKTEGAPCGFCIGLGQVSGAWRENLDTLKRNGTWVGTSATYGDHGEPTGHISRVVRYRSAS